MCFGGGGGDTKIAKQTRADEVARQNRIKQGMAQIDAIFGGTSLPEPTPTVTPNFTGMGGLFGGIPALFPNLAPDPTAPPAAPVTSTGGFNDAFFADRAQDYVDYATPQLDKQVGDTRKQLIYALSRTGNLDSSAAIERMADLDNEANVARVGIANQGLDQANQLRQQVEQTRSNLVAELNATGDNEAAASAALRAVENLSAPAGYSPLGNLFANFANTIGQIGSNAGNGYSGFAHGGGRTLFTTDGNAQRIVGG